MTIPATIYTSIREFCEKNKIPYNTIDEKIQIEDFFKGLFKEYRDNLIHDPWYQWLLEKDTEQSNQDSEEVGYKRGHESGYDEGYDEGYEDGFNSGLAARKPRR